MTAARTTAFKLLTIAWLLADDDETPENVRPFQTSKASNAFGPLVLT